MSQTSDKKSILNKLQLELQQSSSNDVKIIAVSKTHGPQKIREFLLAGQKNFAENRINEARDKFPLVETSDLFASGQPIYHHVGPLQSGNARQICGLFHYVHGVSSWSALDALLTSVDKYIKNKDKHYVLKYLIQINLTAEDSKAGGMLPDELLKQNTLPKTTGCYPVGLMTMGPTNQDAKQTQSVFENLRKLRDEKIPGGELSMGMSGDWKIAVEQGSTMIRIGSLLFGKRNAYPWKSSAQSVN